MYSTNRLPCRDRVEGNEHADAVAKRAWKVRKTGATPRTWGKCQDPRVAPIMFRAMYVVVESVYSRIAKPLHTARILEACVHTKSNQGYVVRMLLLSAFTLPSPLIDCSTLPSTTFTNGLFDLQQTPAHNYFETVYHGSAKEGLPPVS